jgi:hypothetical protein
MLESSMDPYVGRSSRCRAPATEPLVAYCQMSMNILEKQSAPRKCQHLAPDTELLPLDRLLEPEIPGDRMKEMRDISAAA